MPGKQKFEEQLAALDGLRHQPAEDAAAQLRKALGHKNNFVVARAADITREVKLTVLIPELLSAFDRFFDDATKSDPQCWAKNAISRALAEFEHPDAQIFLRGMRHEQYEPVWGGQSDTAGTLRGTCAHALVQCHSVPEPELLRYLVDLLADKDKSVRAEAVRAIEEVNSAAAAVALRVRAVIYGDEPEVMGACFTGILHIEGKSAIPWLARFLASGDDTAGEAALAIASDRSLEAFEALKEKFSAGRRIGKTIEAPIEPWFRSVLLSAMALTRQEAALEFLLDLIQSESSHAEAAIEAVVRSYPSPEVVEKVEKLVAGNNRLKRVLAEQRALSKS